MKSVIRIGSRESRLAVTQTELVKKQIEQAYPSAEVQIVTMKTTGDRILNRSLDQIGGKGLFVKELDQALAEGRIDLSVHSLKDMPMEIPVFITYGSRRTSQPPQPHALRHAPQRLLRGHLG